MKVLWFFFPHQVLWGHWLIGTEPSHPPPSQAVLHLGKQAFVDHPVCQFWSIPFTGSNPPTLGEHPIERNGENAALLPFAQLRMTGKGIEGLSQVLKASKWWRQNLNLGSLSSECTLKHTAVATLLTRAVQNVPKGQTFKSWMLQFKSEMPPTGSCLEPSLPKACHFESCEALRMLGSKSRSLEVEFEGCIHLWAGLVFSAFQYTTMWTDEALHSHATDTTTILSRHDWLQPPQNPSQNNPFLHNLFPEGMLFTAMQ